MRHRAQHSLLAGQGLKVSTKGPDPEGTKHSCQRVENPDGIPRNVAKPARALILAQASRKASRSGSRSEAVDTTGQEAQASQDGTKDEHSRIGYERQTAFSNP